MRFTPVIALVDDITMERLQPLITELAATWQEGVVNSNVLATMRMNGWTPDAIAWGMVIAAASLTDLEIGTVDP